MITSAQNPKIQQVRSLLTRKRERYESRSYVVEGIRLVEEALASGAVFKQVLFSAGLSERGEQLLQGIVKRGFASEEISTSLMESVAGTESPQGILAVLAMAEPPLPEQLDFVVVIDNLRDPGNLGTIFRASAAAGVQAIFLTPQVVDPYSPKVVRAGMGAHFRIPVCALEWREIAKECKERSGSKLRFYLAEAASGQTLWEIDLQTPAGIVIGGEAEGAGLEARKHVDASVRIPMPGGFESLNAASAAAILIFEVVRQRQKHT